MFHEVAVLFDLACPGLKRMTGALHALNWRQYSTNGTLLVKHLLYMLVVQ